MAWPGAVIKANIQHHDASDTSDMEMLPVTQVNTRMMNDAREVVGEIAKVVSNS